MRGVAEGVAGRRTVSKHPAPRRERKQRPERQRPRGRRPASRNEQRHRERGEQRPKRRHEKGGAPPVVRRRETSDRERKRRADSEEGGIERDVAALVGPGDAVGEQAQTRHVRGRYAHSEHDLEQHRAPEPGGGKAKARARGGGEQSPREVDPARIDAVGERGGKRYCGHIAGEEHPTYDAGLRIGEGPRVAQLGKQRRIGRKAQHRQDVGYEQNERGAVYRFLNAGLRFSRKAAMPSFWSSSANCDWNTRRSNRTPSASDVSYARLIDSLIIMTTGNE